jgi:hypothetical protein
MMKYRTTTKMEVNNMGWTFYDSHFTKPNGEVDRKAELDSGFADQYTVVKSAMVGTVYYAAIKDNNSQEVFAWIALTSSDKHGGCNFGYKGGDEGFGWNEARCPASIIKLLSPTDNKSAMDWRMRCIENAASKKSPDRFGNLPLGTRIVWTIPNERFTGGKMGEKLELIKARIGRGHAYWYCPAGNWRTNPKNVNMKDCVILERG